LKQANNLLKALKQLLILTVVAHLTKSKQQENNLSVL